MEFLSSVLTEGDYRKLLLRRYLLPPIFTRPRIPSAGKLLYSKSVCNPAEPPTAAVPTRRIILLVVLLFKWLHVQLALLLELLDLLPEYLVAQLGYLLHSR